METTHNSCSPAIVFRSNKVRDDGEVGDPSLQMTIVATASESPRVTILEGGASAVFSKAQTSSTTYDLSSLVLKLLKNSAYACSMSNDSCR